MGDISGIALVRVDGNSTPHSPHTPSDDAFSSLYPAIIQCFTIIFLGYVTGRGGWISTSQAKGLNVFTSTFALPALLFSSMATLDWTKVEWRFIGAIFISKASLFLIVLIFTLFIKRPCNIGLAALAGICVTQSNDFALGYPIVQAIYGATQPQFLQYIYLIAPISLVILNPIGFVLLELHKARSENISRSKVVLMLSVMKQIVTNPIIVMTTLGVIANFIFNHHLPLILNNLLTTLGQAFSACALFILGLSIVGKFNKTMTSLLLGSGMLIFAKLLLFPMLSMGFTRALDCGDSANATDQYAMFAFLYGTFPTAPSVFLYATQYGVGADLIATSLVLGTVASAPLMFTSAMMLRMQIFTVDVQSLVAATSFDVGVLGLICSVAVVILFVVTKRACRMPQMMVLVIALFQALITVGAIMNTSRSTADNYITAWQDYVMFAIHSLGILGVSMMTTVTAVTIYYISCHSLCRALTLRPWLLCYGIVSPVLVVGGVMLIGHFTASLTMMYTDIQLGIFSAVLILNVIMTIVILIMRHRQSHIAQISNTGEEVDRPVCSRGSRCPESCNGASPNEEDAVSDSSWILNSGNSTPYGACSPNSGNGGGCSSAKNPDKKALLANIEDIIPSPSPSSSTVPDERMCLLNKNCSPERVRRCKGLLEKYDKVNEDSMYSGQYQLGRVVTMLVVLLLCQIIAAFYYVWKIVLSELSNTGLFVEVQFIYVALTTGQGFFTFLIFGLDSQMVLAPVKRLLKRALNRLSGKESQINVPSKESQQICQQFSKHHLTHCRESLERIHSSKQDCFSGFALASWISNAGLAGDSSEAQIYAEHLLQGGIIKACSKRSFAFFNTKRHIYQFTRFTV